MYGCGRDETGPWASVGSPPRPPRRRRGCCRPGGPYGGYAGPLYSRDVRCRLSGGWGADRRPGPLPVDYSAGCLGRGLAATVTNGAGGAARAPHHFRLGLTRASARAHLFGCGGPGLDYGPLCRNAGKSDLLQCRRGSRTSRGHWQEAPAQAAPYSRRSGGVSSEAYHQRRQRDPQWLGLRPRWRH